MKKISFFMLLLSVSLSLFAKDKFYYSGGKKIPLQEVKGKEVVIIPTVTSQVAKIFGDKEKKEIEDKRLIINVLSDLNAASLKTVKSLSIPVHIEQCYKDPQGFELTPTGYINLKLKAPGDHELLEKRAAELGLQIIERNSFMPQWYELLIDFESGESVIDIANRLYETGDFASCAPAFYFDAREKEKTIITPLEE